MVQHPLTANENYNESESPLQTPISHSITGLKMTSFNHAYFYAVLLIIVRGACAESNLMRKTLCKLSAEKNSQRLTYF